LFPFYWTKVSKMIKEENYSPLSEYFKEEGVETQEMEPLEFNNTENLEPNHWVSPYITNPWIILLANLVQPGFGHILMGQTKKGFGILLLSIIGDSILFFLCFLWIGFLILPFVYIFEYWVILYDGWVLSKRLHEGIPVMEGECSTKWVKPGLSYFVDPVFNHSVVDECPVEWINKIDEVKLQKSMHEHSKKSEKLENSEME
jgi:hypothetical protein